MHHRNEPNVHKAEELPNPNRWHGAELSVTILGNWQYYRAKIHKYAAIDQSFDGGRMGIAERFGMKQVGRYAEGAEMLFAGT